MKHALALLGALVLLVVAGFILWFTRTSLATKPLIMIAPGLCIAFAFGLAIPANAKEAGAIVGDLSKTVASAIRGGTPSGGAT